VLRAQLDAFRDIVRVREAALATPRPWSTPWAFDETRFIGMLRTTGAKRGFSVHRDSLEGRAATAAKVLAAAVEHLLGAPPCLRVIGEQAEIWVGGAWIAAALEAVLAECSDRAVACFRDAVARFTEAALAGARMNGDDSYISDEVRDVLGEAPAIVRGQFIANLRALLTAEPEPRPAVEPEPRPAAEPRPADPPALPLPA
jgi:hypothetical protein